MNLIPCTHVNASFGAPLQSNIFLPLLSTENDRIKLQNLPGSEM